MSGSQKKPTAWKIILDRMTGNVALSQLEVLMHVVINKAEKHLPYGGLVGNVINWVSHKARSL